MLEAKLSTLIVQLASHEQRFEELESTLDDPGRNIEPDQAMQISQAVKDVAFEIENGQTERTSGDLTANCIAGLALPATSNCRPISLIAAWGGRQTGIGVSPAPPAMSFSFRTEQNCLSGNYAWVGRPGKRPFCPCLALWGA